jgi:hypothetical protein
VAAFFAAFTPETWPSPVKKRGVSNPAPRPPVARSPQPDAAEKACAPLIDLPRLRNVEPAQRSRLVTVSAVTFLWFALTVWA